MDRNSLSNSGGPAGGKARRELGSLSERERTVVEHLLDHRNISRNVNEEFTDSRTVGERLADRMAAFGGSWTFILSFAFVLTVWVVINSFVLPRREVFDPFPFILLNLCLSMLAAVQGPIIMMSQNRQAARDRMNAAHDYEVNLKAELEIRSLHQKLDLLREQAWVELVEMQRDQISILERLLDRTVAGGGEPPPPPTGHEG